MMKRLLLFLTAVMVTSSLLHASVNTNGSPSLSNQGDGAAICSAVWTGATTTYTATPYTGLSAAYIDGQGMTKGTYIINDY